MRSFIRWGGPFAAAALLWFAAGCGAAAGSGDTAEGAGRLLPATVESSVLGVLNGEEIHLEDLEQGFRMQLAKLRNEYYTEAHRLLEEGAIQAARERLLEEAAAEKGLTLNLYYSREIGVPEVTDAEVEQVYEQNRQQLGGRPLDQIRTDLRRQIANQRLNRDIQIAGDNFLREAEWDLTVPAFRLPVETEGHAALGPEDAPVKLVVFSDFECPFCKRFNTSLDRLREDEEYADRIQFVFRHYPLRGLHPSAQKAAEASICAGDQDRFWEFHDALWTDDSFDPDTLEQHARLLGLDTDTFTECLNSGRYYDRVQADLEAAMELGQTGTPAVFTNGRYIGGALSFQQLRAEIDRELAAVE